MTNEINELYSEIAEKINEMIPIEWNKFFYLGEIEREKASWSSVFYFINAETKSIMKSHDIPSVFNVSEDIYEELLEELDELLLKLYDCFSNEGYDVWGQISLTVEENGEFNADFIYDSISDSEYGQAEREIIWAYETFKFLPKEKTYSRKILDEYLSKKND